MPKNVIIVIFVVIVVLIVGGLGLVFLDGDVQPSNNNTPQPVSLPEGWVFQEVTACNVQMPLPPRREPYVSDQGEYWRFEQNTQENTIFFPTTGVVIFQNPEADGSGYVAGAVIVSCRTNIADNSPEMVARQYGQYLADQSQPVPEEAKLTLKMEEKITMWGQKVQVVSIEGGMFNPEDKFYITTGNGLAYIVSKPSMSTEAFVRQTTEDIFTKLNFK